MPSVSTLVNGVRQKIAGRALMDVAFSSTSTNGVQNKIIKAKFDEVEGRLSRKIVVTNTANETFSSLLNRLYSQLSDVSALDLAKATLVRTNTTLDYKWGVGFHFRIVTDTTIAFSTLSGDTGDGSIVAEMVHLKASGSRYMVVNRRGASGVAPTVETQEHSNKIAGTSDGEEIWTLEW